MTLSERLDIYEKLMRLDKPIGILLLLWPTLWGLWLASLGSPNPWIAAVFVLGVVLMRSAGCVINDFADREFDRHVERTRNRPLAARLISPKEALLLAAGLTLLAFLLVLQLNWLTIKLSAVALALAVIYPFLKRVFWLPQAWLGIAFGFGIQGDCVRHRICDGRPRRRHQAGTQVVGDIIRAFRRCGGDDLPCPVSALHGVRGRQGAVRAGLFCGSRRGGMHRRLSISADSRAPPRRLLPSFYAEQLGWRRDMVGYRRGIRVAHSIVRRRPPRALNPR